MSDYEQFISDKATEINSMPKSKRYDRLCELLRAEWSVNKTSNEYADALRGIYDDCPKAVLAAIAVSSLTCGGAQLDQAKKYVADEWRILHQSGIVPQKPPKSVTAYIPNREDTCGHCGGETHPHEAACIQCGKLKPHVDPES